MWVILMSLVIGVTIGLLKILPDKYVKFNSKFQQAGIMLLLFSMGASIGANKALLYNLKSMGIKAAVFAVTTCVFSVAAVYFISSRYMKGDKTE